MRFQLDNKQALRMTRKLETCMLPCFGFRCKLLGNRNSQRFFQFKDVLVWGSVVSSSTDRRKDEVTKWWESFEPTKPQLVHSDWNFSQSHLLHINCANHIKTPIELRNDSFLVEITNACFQQKYTQLHEIPGKNGHHWLPHLPFPAPLVYFPMTVGPYLIAVWLVN